MDVHALANSFSVQINEILVDCVEVDNKNEQGADDPECRAQQDPNLQRQDNSMHLGKGPRHKSACFGAFGENKLEVNEGVSLCLSQSLAWTTQQTVEPYKLLEDGQVLVGEVEAGACIPCQDLQRPGLAAEVVGYENWAGRNKADSPNANPRTGILSHVGSGRWI